MWTFDADQKSRLPDQYRFSFSSQRLFCRCRRLSQQLQQDCPERQPLSCRYPLQPSSFRSCILLAIRTAFKSCFIIEMTIITLLHRVLLVFRRKCDCMERCAAVCVRRAFSVLQFYCYLQSTRRAVIRVCRMRAKTRKMRFGAGAPGEKSEKAEHLGNVRLVTYSDILRELVAET